MYKSWIEISRKALISNLKHTKKVVGKEVKIIAMIKANAYGHGLKEIVEIIKENKDVDVLGVDSLEEALLIKRYLSKPILVLGYIPLSSLKKVIDNRISFVVYNVETLRRIASIKSGEKARIHLKIETGLNRQGVKLRDLPSFLKEIELNRDKYFVEGVYSHFADATSIACVHKQLKIFNFALKIIDDFGFVPRYIHFASTGAIFKFKNSHFNTVRLGIGLYGLWEGLSPVLAWKSLIAQVKDIDKNDGVSYGWTWKSNRKSKVAVVSVGYSDGIDRKLSNCGRVLVKGKYAPIVGRVAMNMIIIDVTKILGVKVEDEVVLIGRQGKNLITADEIAERLGTINYEIIARINPLLPRVVV